MTNGLSGLEPISLPSASERVLSELRKAILTKQLQEGQILTLEGVASQLNVSAMPVREAFQTLDREGLIQQRRNKAAVVLGMTEKFIHDHYQLRQILESAAAGLCCEEGTNISGIKEAFRKSEEKMKQNDYAEYSQLNYDFHKQIWIASGNEKLLNMLKELWNGLSMGALVSEEDYAKQSYREHKAIMKAISARDAEKAETEMKNHIERSRNDIMTHYR